jgi:phenylacetate-CoA ligase
MRRASREPQTRAELDALKLEKFRALVRHANIKSPYYAQIIRSRGIDPDSCVPEQFPVLTKSALMTNFDGIVTDRRITRQVVAEFLSRSSDPGERLFGEFTVLHTSGTSGEVGYFLNTDADAARMTRRPLRRPGVGSMPRRARRLRRFRIAFYGATGGHYAGVTGMRMAQRGLRRLFLKTASFEVNTPLPGVITQLNDFEPDVLLGYTTALKMLADEQRAGRLRIRPVAVVASGEIVTAADLQLLSESFGGAHTMSLYACTEHMILGASNPDGKTMTLFDDHLIFEFHEDHSVITNLYNHTMPLIRYRMSDILRPVSAPDARHIVIESLVGRAEKLPTFLNGAGATDFLSPHTINEIFVKDVTRFQMQLTGPSEFRFPICVAEGLSTQARGAAAAAVTARLHEVLRQKGLDNVRFEVPIVDQIPVNERTRKFQLIVDQRAQAQV